MLTDKFRPNHSEKPVKTREFIAEMKALARIGEMNDAASKLSESAMSENKLGNFENAAVFYNCAGDILIKSGIAEDREYAINMYMKSAEEYENAGIMAFKKSNTYESAILFKLAANVYKLGGGNANLKEAARCFEIAASFFEHAANFEYFENANAKESKEIMLIFSAESNRDAAKMYLSLDEVIDEDSKAIVDNLIKASERYGNAGEIVRSADCIVDAELYRIIGSK